ncbi:MAG: hypothetical protein HZC55_10520 [Verrucomicrobia bacterium]|nr:hypothetical protein [Verrucomicrobiota bacterium]
MKDQASSHLVLRAGAVVVALLLLAGCRQLMAPAARAFGVPSESELAKCRAALRQFQSGLPNATIEIAAVLTVDERGAVWRRPLAVDLQREVATRTTARLTLPTQRPTVAPTPLGRNQLRYLWTRAADYTRALQAARPEAGYVLQAEIFSHGGKVTALHLFVFAADGQPAYCRLFNSHHFGAGLAADDTVVIPWIVRKLFDDLRREPGELFPPHGVG